MRKISILVLLTLCIMLLGSNMVFAQDQEHEVTYKEATLYRSVVAYENGTPAFTWEKIPNPSLKWETTVKYGKFLKKDIIKLGEKKLCEEKVYGIGGAFYFNCNKPSKIYYTPNTKLAIGDNTLSTVPILYQKNGVNFWFRWDFVLNLSPVVPATTTETVTTSNSPSTTPSNTPVVSPSVEPSTTDGDGGADSLPKTGEESPAIYAIIGIVVLAVGIGLFAKMKLNKC